MLVAGTDGIVAPRTWVTTGGSTVGAFSSFSSEKETVWLFGSSRGGGVILLPLNERVRTKFGSTLS